MLNRTPPLSIPKAKTIKLTTIIIIIVFILLPLGLFISLNSFITIPEHINPLVNRGYIIWCALIIFYFLNRFGKESIMDIIDLYKTFK